MSWVGLLYIVVMLVVFAELYAMRGLINRLYEEVERLNERYQRMRTEKFYKELHEE